MIITIEYLAVVVAILVFIFQLLYKFGKLSGKVTMLDENVCWIRDYLMCSGLDMKHFKQNSPVGFEKEDGENILPLQWKEKLKTLKMNVPVTMDPLRTATYLTNTIGLFNFFEEANDLDIDINTLILSSAIFYNKMHQAEMGKDVDLSKLQSGKL